MIAVCGLDCGSCEIFKVPTDPEAAESVTSWFKEMGWLEEGKGVSDIVKDAPYCMGCRGDRAVHWSSDCWILKCCVDDKGHDYCHECEDFPCEKLKSWSRENDRYSRALERLKEMRKEKG